VLRKILIANRGEIAVRIQRTLREMQIPSVAVFTGADRTSLHVRRADEAVPIENYLRIDCILDAARKVGADAIHPGYGFLSENPEFAAACEHAGVKFIGPSAESIRRMGSKTEARKMAMARGVPLAPGTPEGLTDSAEAVAFAREVGYPVMLKAVAGGGGKGMRRVDRESDFDSCFATASAEAAAAFANPALYIEKLILDPRHVEIQVIGDEHGHMIHLGERECSIQRRHQKLVEECPSPLMMLDHSLRDQIGTAAVRAARAAGYFNAGTVEFLVDADHKFYFLEMNTRLQVEHPVTEMVTGLDMVRLQVEIAAGARLRLHQEEVEWRGSAMECRIFAEDPENNFFPSPGRIQQYAEPAGPGIRVDSGVYPGWTVPLEYDPLLAKLVVWAGGHGTMSREPEARLRAAARMHRALGEYHVLGIATNIEFSRGLVTDPEFLAGKLDTGFLERYFDRRVRAKPVEEALAIAAEVVKLSKRNALHAPTPAVSAWRSEGRAEMLR
jgi:acetyl-CoA carboxylase biotin carboxylase subunit